MPRERLLTRPFVFVSLANLFMGLSFSLFVHFPGFLQDFGADEVQIGVIVGVAAISSIVVRPWIGTAMDVRGRRPLILVGNVMNIVALSLYLTVTSLGVWVYVVRTFHGLAVALLFTSLFTLGADVVPAGRRTEGLALFGVSGLLPIALGGVLGDVVLAGADFEALFLVAVACAVIALVASLPLRDVPSDVDAEPRRGFLAAVAQRDLLPLWWIAGVFSLVLSGYFIFLKTYVDETGIGSVGTFFAVYAGTAIALRLFFAWVPQRVGERRVLVPALGMLAAGFVVLATAGSDLHVAAAGLLCGAGHGYAFPILYGFTVTRARTRDRGSALAFFTSLFDVGMLVGGVVLGALISWFGYTTMYVVAGGILVGATAIYLSWDRAYDIRPDGPAVLEAAPSAAGR